MLRISVFVVFGVLSVMLIGCAGSNGAVDPRAGESESGFMLSRLPSLPGVHAASVLMDFTQAGTDAGLRALEATEEGTSLRLASAPGGMCWGIWGFSSAAAATACIVDFNGDLGSQAYFAISNYDKGAWELGGPLSGPQAQITINDQKYSNNSGELYIAVIAYNDASILVDKLVLTADIAPIIGNVDFSGGYTSLALVNGMPAISYYDTVDDNLRYVHATDLFGATWGAPLTLDSTGDTGQFTSLKVVDGNPAVAYYDNSAKLLRYVRATDADGATWGTPVTVASALATGEYCSLEMVAGNPAISYYDFDSGELRYVRALDSTGATWGAPISPDSNGNTGFYSSLEVVDGFPAISYRNGNAGQLWYVRGLDAEGSTWGAPLMVDDVNNPGSFSSLVVVNGSPAICYYASTMGDLMYARALDAAGAAWGAPQMLDGAQDEGSYCSMAVIGGIPAISYHSGLNGDLRYIKALDVDGAAWGPGVILDESSVITGRDTSLFEVYGMPAISYFDQSNGMLNYAWGF